MVRLAMARRAIVISLLLLDALCARASAEPVSDARAEAGKHFDRGLELFDDGSFEPAAVEFRRAYELSPNFATLFNLGMAYVALGRPVEAVDTLERYLAEGGAQVPADKRALAVDEIARQKRRIAQLTIRVSADGAVVEVDGVEVGKTPLAQPVRVGVGERRITVSGDGFRAVTRYESVAGEENRVVEIKVDVVKRPEPAPAVSAPAAQQSTATAELEGAARTAPPASASTSSGPGAWPWVLVGVSGGLAAGGGILLALAQRDISTVEDAEPGVRWPELEPAYEAAPAKSAAGIALLAVGAAGIATGLVWALLGGGDGDETESAVDVTLGAGRVAVRGSF